MSTTPPQPAQPQLPPHPAGNHPEPARRPGLRPGRLGVGAIVFFVVAAVAPMAAIVGASPIVFSANGVAAPATYLLAALLFVVFSVGYVAMSRHITNAGGFVAYCFTGFEATVVFSEEAKDPHRTIPRAVYYSIAFIGLFYALTTWALGNSVGADAVQEAATADPAGFVFTIAEHEVGTWLATAMEILVVTSFIAMLIGFQNMFARYLYALGRANVLPHRLGTARPNTGTPATAALVVGIGLAVVLAGFTLAGADPITVTFSWLLSLGTVSLIAILILTSASIIAFFARTRVETSIWTTRIAPAVALLGFGVVAYLAVANYDVLLGGQGGVARWLLLLIPLCAALGFTWASIRPTINYQADLV